MGSGYGNTITITELKILFWILAPELDLIASSLHKKSEDQERLQVSI